MASSTGRVASNCAAAAHLILAAEAIAAVTLLAWHSSIDGATAVGAVLVALSASSGGMVATHVSGRSPSAADVASEIAGGASDVR
jgi:hypothetical protein